MDIAAASKFVALVGSIAAGAWVLDDRHAPRSQVQKMEAGQHVQAIQGWIMAARAEGASPYICDAIRFELAELCTEAPDHYLCSADGMRDTLRRAGC
jgi:hypothetical protein